MAYVKTWSTKEEVLKDLARASGRRVKKNDIDEGYLVIGDAPPPVITEDEDAEMQLLFGDAVSRKTVQEEDATPDLAGIQQMLRMMQDFSGNDDDDPIDGDTSKECVIAISKVSRLNPNVPEFIPNSCSSRSTSNKDTKSNVVVTQPVNVKSSKKEPEVSGNEKDLNENETQVNRNKKILNENGTQNVDNNKELNENETQNVDNNTEFNENETQDIATTLKNQISVGSKSDLYEVKKQKNVAIATLLRLYARGTPENTAPLKLLTPQYYEGKAESESKAVEAPVNVVPLVNVSPVNVVPPVNVIPPVNVVPPVNVASPTTSTSTPEPRESSNTLPSTSTFSTSTSSTTPFATSPRLTDPEIKKSIDKVNRWLGEPSKRKSPAVCLGPIAFKRKEPVNCKSPMSDNGSKTSKPSGDSKQYRPSKYAADLGKQYLERSKAIESKQEDVTWTNLEEKLKEKDLMIKQRLGEQASD